MNRCEICDFNDMEDDTECVTCIPPDWENFIFRCPGDKGEGCDTCKGRDFCDL
jgi:hypothetical protein